MSITHVNKNQHTTLSSISSLDWWRSTSWFTFTVAYTCSAGGLWGSLWSRHFDIHLSSAPLEASSARTGEQTRQSSVQEFRHIQTAYKQNSGQELEICNHKQDKEPRHGTSADVPSLLYQKVFASEGVGIRKSSPPAISGFTQLCVRKHVQRGLTCV